jgi:hypothetical protein
LAVAGRGTARRKWHRHLLGTRSESVEETGDQRIRIYVTPHRVYSGDRGGVDVDLGGFCARDGGGNYNRRHIGQEVKLSGLMIHSGLV